MKISRPDSRRRYSILHVISAGSHFTLIAYSQANFKGILAVGVRSYRTNVA